ncbi:MAG TPA: site-2 protease family protein [Ilumatobacteraceae bacterium]|nr:site-2 protease family protein [Ilumatobacteraceae bacterium]
MSDTYSKFRNEVMAGGTDKPDADATAGGATAVIGLAVILALLVVLYIWSTWAFVFVVGLLISIFLHELGHFVTARLMGMKATQFFLFMGPKLWSFRRGETEYGLRAYPVGAFVRIIGMNNLDEVDPSDEPRAYRNKSYPRRMLVITAGSVMHILIAIVLIFGVYAVNGRRVETDRVGIGSVAEGNPANLAGVQPGDIILSIDGVNPKTPEQFVDQIHSHQPGDAVTLVIDRDGTKLTKIVGLGTNPTPGEGFGKAFLGVSSGTEVVWNNESIARAASDSVFDLGPTMWRSIGGVVKVLNPVNIFGHLSGTNDDINTRPTTVVGISKLSASIGDESGFGGLLLTLAAVNVFVGLLNLFPVLPFDGGHAAIATYERLRSRRGRAPYRADITKMIPVAMTMIAVLAMLFITGLYLDVTKPLP